MRRLRFIARWGQACWNPHIRPVSTYELRKRGLQVATEVVLPVVYDGQKIDAGYPLDMLVED